MKRYALGLDFGTLSVRALLLDTVSGKETAQAVSPYAHGVMDTALPDGSRLPPDYALQHPQDYLDSLCDCIAEVIRKAGISPDEIGGIGIDFTASTVMPCRIDGTPLCTLTSFEHHRHAYVKLWKHHAAEKYAQALSSAAAERQEPFLKYYSGTVSGEWLFPKLWQILDEDEEVYRACELFIEAGDWIVYRLTGTLSRSSCIAGYKALWHHELGYPSKDFLACLDKRLENAVEEKLKGPVVPIGGRAGSVTKEAAAFFGLTEGTPVGVCVIDAHAAMPAAGITSPGKLLMIMGTSNCHLLVSELERPYEGICGIVYNGIIGGYFGYEAGQSCAGDHFDWIIHHALPASYTEEAAERGIDIHALLDEKASRSAPGESGLLALDWWNGVRSDLMDASLSGALIGMTLTTRAEDIYRALIEATAYGTRVIVENYEKAGVKVKELYACGGLAAKNPFLMQIYADVLNRPIKLVSATQAGALGSAMNGAVIGGLYASIDEAAAKVTEKPKTVYQPLPANAAIYEKLYRLYLRLHDRFGKDDPLMKELRSFRTQNTIVSE